MIYDTLTEACRAWVNEFNFIPSSVIEKLAGANYEDIYEVTPPSKYDRVTVTCGKYRNQDGEIIKTNYRGENQSLILFDNGKRHIVNNGDLNVVRDYQYPIWGTFFSFKESIDNDWISGYFGNGLQALADCGFRVFESEDFGYVFGIDGAGYDFYEYHWIPLYKARGLHWHKKDDTKKKKGRKAA